METTWVSFGFLEHQCNLLGHSTYFLECGFTFEDCCVQIWMVEILPHGLSAKQAEFQNIIITKCLL